MKQRITYSDTGERRYQIDDKDVTEEQFWAITKPLSSGRLKDMLDSQTAPHGVSDNTYMVGYERQFSSPRARADYDQYKAITEAHGGNTNGKRYVHGLAAFPGDPKAWVSGRDDVKRVLEERGWSGEGMVNVKAREALNPPDRTPHVSEELIEEYAVEIASQDERPEMVDMEDLKSQVRERISPKGAKKRAKSARKVKVA